MRQPFFEGRQPIRGDEVGSHTSLVDAISTDALACETKIDAKLSVQAGKEEVCAYIREEADVCLRLVSVLQPDRALRPAHFRHRNDCFLCSYAEGCMHRKAYSSAH